VVVPSSAAPLAAFRPVTPAVVELHVGDAPPEKGERAPARPWRPWSLEVNFGQREVVHVTPQLCRVLERGTHFVLRQPVESVAAGRPLPVRKAEQPG